MSVLPGGFNDRTSSSVGGARGDVLEEDKGGGTSNGGARPGHLAAETDRHKRAWGLLAFRPGKPRSCPETLSRALFPVRAEALEKKVFVMTEKNVLAGVPGRSRGRGSARDRSLAKLSRRCITIFSTLGSNQHTASRARINDAPTSSHDAASKLARRPGAAWPTSPSQSLQSSESRPSSTGLSM